MIHAARRSLPLLGMLLFGGTAWAQPAGTEKRAALDNLLGALKAAPTEEAAVPIEAHVRQLWLDQGSPAVGLLMSRGFRDLKAGAHEEAIADFSDAIALDPAFAEAWHQRAIARYEQGDTMGAIRDIEETLKREPRHFKAWETLSHIAENRKDWKGAYAAWQKVLDIDPKTPGGEQRLKDLKRRALGEQT
jgi:tetratricopeptide (TPR) repeat protein